MSSDETPNVPTPSHSRAAVREKAQQVNAQQSRARIVRRVIIGLVAVVVVAAAGGAVAWAVGSAVSKPSLSPSNLKDDGVVLTKADLAAIHAGSTPTPTPTTAAATPTASASPSPAATPGAVDIHVYVDYLSPGAGDFERANAKQLATWVSQDAATVTYHPVALLTANSNGTKYSLRAASAVACVAAREPDVFYAFNHALLVDQPKQDTDGRSDKELIDLAVSSGVKDAKGLQSCVEESTYDSWVKDVTQRAVDGPLPGSKKETLGGAPTIVVNGQVYAGSLNDAAEFSQFVLSVASDSYYGTPGPTLSPTPTPSTTP